MKVTAKEYKTPKGFNRAAGLYYRMVIGLLMEQDTWKPADRPLVEQYVRCLETALDARTQRKGLLTDTGSQGQPVVHPLLRIEREAEKDAAKLADQLLLSPSSRMRAGLKEVSVDDALEALLA